MKNLILTGVIAVILGFAPDARSATEGAGDYVQSGLYAHWDAIDNAGTGAHDAGAKVWKDLKGHLGDFPVLAGEYWTNSLALYINSSVADPWTNLLTSTAFVIPDGAFTIEIVLRADASGGSNGSPRRYDAYPRDELFESWWSDSENLLERVGSAGYGGGRVSCGALTLGRPFSTSSVYANKTITAHKWELGILTSSATRQLTYGFPTSYRLQFCRSTAKVAVYAIRVYNRALTAEEIEANANLDGRRFGFTQTTYRTAKTGDWNEPANWHAYPEGSNRLPAKGDNAAVSYGAGEWTLGLQDGFSTPALHSLELGRFSSSTTAVHVTDGATLWVTNTLWAGSRSAGVTGSSSLTVENGGKIVVAPESTGGIAAATELARLNRGVSPAEWKSEIVIGNGGSLYLTNAYYYGTAGASDTPDGSSVLRIPEGGTMNVFKGATYLRRGDLFSIEGGTYDSLYEHGYAFYKAVFSLYEGARVRMTGGNFKFRGNGHCSNGLMFYGNAAYSQSGGNYQGFVSVQGGGVSGDIELSGGKFVASQLSCGNWSGNGTGRMSFHVIGSASTFWNRSWGLNYVNNSAPFEFEMRPWTNALAVGAAVSPLKIEVTDNDTKNILAGIFHVRPMGGFQVVHTNVFRLADQTKGYEFTTFVNNKNVPLFSLFPDTEMWDVSVNAADKTKLNATLKDAAALENGVGVAGRPRGYLPLSVRTRGLAGLKVNIDLTAGPNPRKTISEIVTDLQANGYPTATETADGVTLTVPPELVSRGDGEKLLFDFTESPDYALKRKVYTNALVTAISCRVLTQGFALSVR